MKPEICFGLQGWFTCSGLSFEFLPDADVFSNNLWGALSAVPSHAPDGRHRALLRLRSSLGLHVMVATQLGFERSTPPPLRSIPFRSFTANSRVQPRGLSAARCYSCRRTCHAAYSAHESQVGNSALPQGNASSKGLSS